MELLILLVGKNGELVSRDEIVAKLWGRDVFVETEHGINTAVRKIRQTLGDDPERPRFVQTVVGKGYRFVGSVAPEADTAPEKPGEKAKSWSRRAGVAFAATASFMVLLAIVGLYLFRTRRPVPDLGPLTITRLTNRGNLADLASSPDGKYLAYVAAAGDQKSLRILQIGTGTDLQLLSPADAQYGGITFSPDSSYIYYTRGQSNASSALYRIPVLGGVPGKLIEDVDSAAGISPDGKQLAFVRYDSTSGTQVLLIANPDGSGEHKVATAKYPEEGFFDGPAWSPDGKVLAIWQTTNLVAIPVNGGPRKVIASNWIPMDGQPAWLADGTGLIVTAGTLNGSSHYQQLWEISYPDGKAIQIIHDPYRYEKASLTADAHTLVALQVDKPSGIWVAPAEDPDRARQVPPFGGHFIGTSGVTWTPDGHILYTSNATGDFELWTANPDGSSARPLPLDQGIKFLPSVCSDARTVVFFAPHDNQLSIVRADLGGGKSQVLAKGRVPRCSPDGRWVLFVSENGLQKVSLEDGEPIAVSNDLCREMFDISRNGEQIACRYRSGPAHSAKLAIIPFSGGRATKLLELPAKTDGPISWTPDGQAVSFEAESGGAVNLWVQPIGGGRPRQLTHFTVDEIQAFAWSPDGRYLALSRGTDMSDAVLVTNFR